MIEPKDMNEDVQYSIFFFFSLQKDEVFTFGFFKFYSLTQTVHKRNLRSTT